MKNNDKTEIKSQKQIIENIIMGNVEINSAEEKELIQETLETPENNSETNEMSMNEQKAEEIVLEFLQSALGNVLVEGKEEEKEIAIMEAIAGLNYTTQIVNDYFDLD
tara:strand:+ start:603 stop:926 length:324 start_codon:yes stop_codon:yes gene_type:complete